MKHRRKIWYSVENMGDGSAYPRWFDTEELAELHQEFMDEGWGEPCVGYVEVESDSPIKVLDDVVTLDDMINEITEDLKHYETYDPESDWDYTWKIKDLKKQLEQLEEIK